jgi:tRNA G18 (ribose-2'-O)-methylase SpoU
LSERGYYAVGVERSKTSANIGTLWRTAHIFGAAFVFTLGRRYTRQASDVLSTPAHVPLIHYRDVDDLVDHLPYGCPLIGVELDARAVELGGFSHPERACYLLGAEDHGLKAQTRERCHRLVQLPGETCLNVAVAGSIVLYDRIAKRA